MGEPTEVGGADRDSAPGRYKSVNRSDKPMLNKIQNLVVFLVALGTKALAGLAQHSATLSLPHTVAEDLPAKMTAMTTANTAHKEAILAMVTKRSALLL